MVKQMGGTRVAQDMWAHVPTTKTSQEGCVFNDVKYRLPCDPLATSTEKYCVLIIATELASKLQRRPRFTCEPIIKRFCSRRSEGHHSFLGTFAEQNNCLCLHVDIRKGKCTNFRNARPRGIQEFKDRTVSRRDYIISADRINQRCNI
jgi:hypothetical protein